MPNFFVLFCFKSYPIGGRKAYAKLLLPNYLVASTLDRVLSYETARDSPLAICPWDLDQLLSQWNRGHRLILSPRRTVQPTSDGWHPEATSVSTKEGCVWVAGDIPLVTKFVET
jgi:hypothetical protein